MIHFTVLGEPVSKERPRFSRGGVYTPTKTAHAENAVALAFNLAAPRHVPVADRAFKVTMTFHTGNRRRCDLDNLSKLVMDALNKVAFADDSQVHSMSALRAFCDPAEARTEVTVEDYGPMPVARKKAA